MIKLRGRHHAEAQYAELPPPERRKAVQAAVLGELRDRGLRSGVQAISTTIQFVLFILVLIWVRFGDVAGSYGFYGLERLRDSSIGSGVSGVVLALLFMASSVAMQVLILRTAAIDSVRQHFFATRMLPVIFLAVGLFLPTGAVLAWLAANVATLIVIATGAHQPAAAVEAS
ncbi:hypothetical protein [Nonomuraea sp. NPDC052265]|uniref:hypothetical protein n=1 Tax=Nonomuraea sp. NPDC052265 TaxID=3364374 RepID=UPI0037CA0842